MSTIIKWIADWFTEADGAACPVRIVGVNAIIIMTVKLAMLAQPDFQGFGVGVAAIASAIVAKGYFENKGS